MPGPIETPRLILRELIAADAAGMFELDSDPEVHRYLGNKPIAEMKQAEEVIKFVQTQYTENGIGRWAMVNKSTMEFMGWVGLKLNRDNQSPLPEYYDVGYRIIRKFWGQGFATEGAIASLEYGFNTLQLPEIFAAAHVLNQASNHILTKIGMQFLQTFKYDGELHNWYKIKNNTLINL